MSKNRGMALVEILIGAAIIAMAIVAASSSFNMYINYALANQENIKASYLLEEGLEVFTFFRDGGWTSNISNLSTNTPYYLYFTGTVWTATTTPQYVDGKFLRSIVVIDLNRDANDDISVAGTNDPNIKQITVTVSYFQGHSTTTKLTSTYISNLYNN